VRDSLAKGTRSSAHQFLAVIRYVPFFLREGIPDSVIPVARRAGEATALRAEAPGTQGLVVR
jgi:hypothetical protein